MTPITNEADYKAALAEIDRFDDSVLGTAEFEQLDNLVDQVEAYEAEHYPISPPSAEATAEYVAEKRGQSFEQAKEATFAQYGDALQQLANVQRKE